MRPRTHLDVQVSGAYLDKQPNNGVFQWSIQKRSSRGNSQQAIKFGQNKGNQLSEKFANARAASNKNLHAARIAQILQNKVSVDNLIPYGDGGGTGFDQVIP